MFTELMPVLQDRPLTITVAALAGGKIKVCVVPQTQDKDSKVNAKVGHQAEKEVAKIPDSAVKALTVPLALTGTPEELDAGFAEQLTTYARSHEQLQHGIAQATREIADAVKAIAERDKERAKAKADTTKTNTSKKNLDDAATAKKNAAPEPDPNATLPLSWCAPAATAAADTQTSPNNNNGGGK